jgi:hypothetical protein
MTLQLLHSEFPYIGGKFFFFFFYQCIGLGAEEKGSTWLLILHFNWISRRSIVGAALASIQRKYKTAKEYYYTVNSDENTTCCLPKASTNGVFLFLCFLRTVRRGNSRIASSKILQLLTQAPF